MPKKTLRNADGFAKWMSQQIDEVTSEISQALLEKAPNRFTGLPVELITIARNIALFNVLQFVNYPNIEGESTSETEQTFSEFIKFANDHRDEFFAICQTFSAWRSAKSMTCAQSAKRPSKSNRRAVVVSPTEGHA